MESHDQLVRSAAAAGSAPEVYEKVVRLLDLLAGLNSHPYLEGHLALKGGTALNLFVFDVPRLSVDIDVNYVGAADLQTMLAERPAAERAIEAVCSRLGLQVRRAPSDHAGGKWRLSFTTASGRPGGLELDLNYLLRTPLWAVATAESRSIGSLPVRRYGKSHRKTSHHGPESLGALLSSIIRAGVPLPPAGSKVVHLGPS